MMFIPQAMSSEIVFETLHLKELVKSTETNCYQTVEYAPRD